MKRVVKLLLAAGVVGGVLAYLKRKPAPPSASPTAPPYVPAKAAPEPDSAAEPAPEQTSPEQAAPVDAPVVPEPDPWVEPTADGGCPDGYPVKAKLSSRIFHVPEGALYERTTPDRCYASVEAAEADGLRASKR